MKEMEIVVTVVARGGVVEKLTKKDVGEQVAAVVEEEEAELEVGAVAIHYFASFHLCIPCLLSGLTAEAIVAC